MNKYENQPGALMPYNTSWPEEWPGSYVLQVTLERLQKDPSKWDNLSNFECRKYYGLDIYSNQRTVVLVTRWPERPHPDNAALAVGALPGFPPTGLTNRFPRICPFSLFDTTNDTDPMTKVLDSTPFYMSIMDVPLCKSVLASDCSTWKWNGANSGSGANASVQYAYDICGSDGTRSLSSNRTENLPLLYCLSEPMTNAFAKLVWSKLVTQIIGATLGLEAVAMLIGWYSIVRNRDHGFPTGFPWTRLGNFKPLSAFCYIMVNLSTVGFTTWISMGAMKRPNRIGAAPRHSGDRNFLLGILIFENGFHALLVVREYLEANYFEELEGLSKGKPRYSIRFSHVHFVWNLGLHQLVSAWLVIAMLDRYLIGSLASGPDKFLPTIISDSVLSGHTGADMIPAKGTDWAGIFSGLIPIFTNFAQVLAVFTLHSIFGKRFEVPPSPPSGVSPRSSNDGHSTHPLRPIQRNKDDRQYGTMDASAGPQRPASFSGVDMVILSPTLSISLDSLEDGSNSSEDLYVMSGALQDDQV